MTFVFLDRLLQLEERRRARFVKCCALSEDYYAQHFPGFPVLPGALLVEAFVQAATIFLAASAEFQRWPVLREVSRARFTRMVQPGDRVEIEVEQRAEGEIRATASVDGERVATASLAFALAAGGESMRSSLDTARAFLGMLRGAEL